MWSLRNTNAANIKQLIVSYKTPVYASGDGRPNYDDIVQIGGHAWVIDGWKETSEIFPVRHVDGTFGYITVYHNNVHCRFGLGGELDGWYIYEDQGNNSDPYRLSQIIYYTL